MQQPQRSRCFWVEFQPQFLQPFQGFLAQLSTPPRYLEVRRGPLPLAPNQEDRCFGYVYLVNGQSLEGVKSALRNHGLEPNNIQVRYMNFATAVMNCEACRAPICFSMGNKPREPGRSADHLNQAVAVAAGNILRIPLRRRQVLCF